MNFSVQGGGERRSGATPNDDNAVQGNLDKREMKFIDEQFLWAEGKLKNFHVLLRGRPIWPPPCNDTNDIIMNLIMFCCWAWH